ncbi:MAG: ABC transporter substrate-binding protein [Verrucomicrobia bacterium]|jgi:microcin C transport system substrate-binding protein|nr:ABC transporter substrate-binding protein [Verrucomicrobiota bacterium]
MLKTSSMLAFAAILIALTGCRRDEVEVVRSSGIDDFIPQYNRFIKNWLEEQLVENVKAVRKAEQEMLSLEGEEREVVEKRLLNLKREEDKLKFRLDFGDFFRFGKPEEVPADLVWEDGMDQEEIGDPRAKKGGSFRVDIRTFPPTLRPFGDNSNNGFRGTLYDDIDLPLVGLHPKSMEMIPGLADQWAVSGDGRTVYFRISQKATYSDGVPVKAGDFIFGSYIRISDDIVNPYAKQFYRENIAGLVVYDEKTLSISLPEPQIYAPVVLGGLSPSPPHFYSEYGPDFTERYQWKFPPTTGAYKVKEEDIVKGVSVTQTRVKDWWAKDRKYYKYRFNPDRIVHTVVRDESKAFELFRAGELDSFYITRPDLWYEKSEIDPVFKGYIERYTFYSKWPALPRGLYVNVSKSLLNERDIRIGIQHAMNWQKVIDVIYRGDFQRLDAFNQGYLLFSDSTIKARPYSITAARAAFRRAGFTQTGRDGILRRQDGTKLSVSVTYAAIPAYDKMFAILREEAINCGFDLRLDPLEPTVSYRKMMQKQHEMTYSAWLVGADTPNFYQFLHSSNARDVRGNLKPQTNNLFAWGRDDTDALSEKVRFALTEEELRQAAFKLQHIIHDEAIFVPAYTTDFLRVGSWRWLRWPDCEETRFCPPVVYEPLEAYVHWIDEDMKKETMEAKRSGKTFPEVNRIFDDYRYPESDLAPEPTEDPLPTTEGEVVQ